MPIKVSDWDLAMFEHEHGHAMGVRSTTCAVCRAARERSAAMTAEDWKASVEIPFDELQALAMPSPALAAEAGRSSSRYIFNRIMSDYPKEPTVKTRAILVDTAELMKLPKVYSKTDGWEISVGDRCQIVDGELWPEGCTIPETVDRDALFDAPIYMVVGMVEPEQEDEADDAEDEAAHANS